METSHELNVEGKVDWKGRPAVKNKHGGYKSSWLVLAMFGFENLASFSLTVNLVTYFTGVMHYDLADAANLLTNYLGTAYILSIPVALLADTYIGRFKASIISGCVEFVALILLTVQAHYPKLKPPPCNVFNPFAHCEKVSGGNAGLLYAGIYLLAAGTAGIKAAVPSHGADQFDEDDPKEARQLSSFFNFLVLALCLGGSISLTLFVWIEDHKGWDWGFGASAFSMILGLIICLGGFTLYRYQVVQGSSAIIEIAQVCVASFLNRKLQLPKDPSELYEITKDEEFDTETEFLPHRDALRFLDKAAIRTSEEPNPWKLCRVTQVENTKIVFGMVPIFCCTIVMTLCLAQLQTFTIEQAYTMKTKLSKHFDFPPASLPIIPVGSVVFLIALYDRVFVPFARKFTGIPTGITHLQRIGAGLLLTSLSMAVAAIVEVKRKRVAKDHNMLDAIPGLHQLPISPFWLSFQHFIFGIADMLTYVGLLEFFYSEAPKGIKSLSTCFLWTSMALGYFLSTVLIKIVNRATRDNTKSGGWLAGNNLNMNHLNLFYWLLAILCLINFFVFLFFAMRYKYKPQNIGPPTDGNNGVPADDESGKLSSVLDSRSSVNLLKK